MNLLLDTHIALWALTADKRLPAAAAALLLDEANTVAMSMVSFWEIAIKHAMYGRSGIACSAADAFDYARAAGYLLLNLEPAHVIAMEKLPKGHADPFDRMLVAQALATPLRLLTHDRKLQNFNDTIIYV